MHHSYLNMVKRTWDEGQVLPSRYGSTRELLNRDYVVRADRFPTRPGFNPRIGVLEGMFLVGGFFDLEAIKVAAPRADHSLFTEYGAYGPRVRDQLQTLVSEMAVDPYGRQHVLYVASAGDTYRSDTPCTTSLQFLYRSNALSVVATMRSSDLIKGLPTDVIQFGVLCQVVAHCLAMESGHVVVQAASSHIYEADYEKAPTNDNLGHVRVLPMEDDRAPSGRFSWYRQWALDEYQRFARDGRCSGLYFTR